MAGICIVPHAELRMAGDVRANEQPGLAALHTLFVREHNRLAAEIAGANPSWSDEEIYQRTRKIVGAIMQSITYNEWLPALLGAHAPDPAGFNYIPFVDPTISNEFATALFRFGHTMVSPQLMRIHPDNHPDAIASLDLVTAFFNPLVIQTPQDFEYILKGLSCQLQQNADPRIIPQLRNNLIGPAGSGGMDLAALNIQRGRNHGRSDCTTALSPQANVFFIPRPGLAFHSLIQSSGSGLKINFIAEPGFRYQVNYGSSQGEMTGELLGETLSSGNATQMLQCHNPGANSVPARFYRIARTAIGQ